MQGGREHRQMNEASPSAHPHMARCSCKLQSRAACRAVRRGPIVVSSPALNTKLTSPARNETKPTDILCVQEQVQRSTPDRIFLLRQIKR
jgi:hypothetical protein